MKKNTEELKGYFKDGAIPSGENFASLIDSMVHRDDFEKWTKQGDISLGANESQWQLRVDEDESLVVGRQEPEAPASVRMPAWVAMEGRVGTYDPRLPAAEQSTSDVHPASVLSVRADGNWNPITEVSSRDCHAYEIVAQMSKEETATSGVLNTFLRATRWSKPKRAIAHAIVTTSASGSRPSIRQTSDPDPRRAWRRLSRWVLALILLLLVVMLPLSLFPYTSALGDSFFESSEVKRTFVVDEISEIVVPILRAYEVVINTIREPCELWLVQTSSDNTRKQKIDEFEQEFKSKAKECAVLVVYSPTQPQTWTVAGFDKEEKPRKITSDESNQQLPLKLNNELSKELGEKRKNLSKITRIATSILGRPVRDNTAYIWGIVALLALYLLVRAVAAIQVHRGSVRLAWKKQGGSVPAGTAAYTLHLRGGGYRNDPSLKVHYHVTRLW